MEKKNVPFGADEKGQLLCIGNIKQYMSFKLKQGVSKLNISKQKLVVLLLLLFLFTLFMTNTTYLNFRESLLAKQNAEQKAILSEEKDMLNIYLSAVSSGMEHLASSYHGDLHASALLFEHYIDFNNDFYQVRFIDTLGFEKIKVYKQNNRVNVTPPEKLQNKSKRYYFQESVKLKEGDVYFQNWT